MYPRILALFSSVPYSKPATPKSTDDAQNDTPINLAPHLTNTSLQTHRGEDGVRLLDELGGCSILSSSESGVHSDDEGLKLTAEDISSIQDQMAHILSETFKAALEMPVHFQVWKIYFPVFSRLTIISAITERF